jgi:hypothetical protein
MITKAEIEALVKNGAKEQDIQKLLKKDLSIFAEVYANPKDEYICFSEFPVGDTGIVDFAVFTHRSTMSIYLIEVKGANFNLVNQSKGTFHADFLEGIDQIIRRKRYTIARDLEFRKNVHDIRRKVESGRSLYNSLLGPKRHLMVDPEKPVNVYGVVIGGRRVDNYEESVKRNEWKESINFTIFLESWDSWLEKVIRT